jgi:hypothetical protein
MTGVIKGAPGVIDLAGCIRRTWHWRVTRQRRGFDVSRVATRVAQLTAHRWFKRNPEADMAPLSVVSSPGEAQT